MWTIIGAGFTGSVLAERIANCLGESVRLLDRRKHVGGDAYEYQTSSGVRVHKYGPHIFYTNSKHIASYIEQFCGIKPIRYKVVAEAEAGPLRMPVDFSAIEAIYGRKKASEIKVALVETFGNRRSVGLSRLLRSRQGKVQEFGTLVKKLVYQPYSERFWHVDLDELMDFVVDRVPIYLGYTDNYHDRRVMGVPARGYAELFTRMLNHPKIHVKCGVEVPGSYAIQQQKVIWTGSADELLGYVFDPLEYVDVEFIPSERISGLPNEHQINYCVQNDFHRVTDQGKITSSGSGSTALLFERSRRYSIGRGERHYPLPITAEVERHRMYVAELSARSPNVVLCGRSGDYRYYSIEQAIGRALHVFGEIVRRR